MYSSDVDLKSLRDFQREALATNTDDYKGRHNTTSIVWKISVNISSRSRPDLSTDQEGTVEIFSKRRARSRRELSTHGRKGIASRRLHVFYTHCCSPCCRENQPVSSPEVVALSCVLCGTVGAFESKTYIQ